MKKKKGILVGGGPINYPFLRRELAKEHDLLIAVDGGGRILHELGQLPDLVLGDYDSLAPSAQEYFTGQGVRLSLQSRIKTGLILKSGWSWLPSRHSLNSWSLGG